MDSMLKMFEKAFSKRSVLDESEFFIRTTHLSRELTHSILEDMEQLGLVTIKRHNKGIIRISRKDKQI